MRKRSRKNRSNLVTEVEKTASLENDRLDTDVLSYVDHFFSHDLNLKPLEPISLLNQQQALRALEQINQTQGLIQEKLQKVQALKRLLKEQ